MLITYRRIIHSDLDNIKKLCEECFPVRYPERWYKSLTIESKYYTLAAIDSEKLVGLIVAKIKTQNQCNPEDANILHQGLFKEHKLLYILSLGIAHGYRKRGIASELLNRLLSNPDFCGSIKAVYLHVLKSNDVAIAFYEKWGFERAGELADYYSIDERLFPALTYSLYLNGGHPPVRFRDYLSRFANYLKLVLCVFARIILGFMRQSVSATAETATRVCSTPLSINNNSGGCSGQSAGLIQAPGSHHQLLLSQSQSTDPSSHQQPLPPSPLVSLMGDTAVTHHYHHHGNCNNMCIQSNGVGGGNYFNSISNNNKIGIDSSPLQSDDYCK